MKVVKVLWIDSYKSNFNWTVAEDVKVEPIYIDSFGIVVKDTDEFIAIAQNYGNNPEQYSNITIIPKGCIKEVFVIHEDNVCVNGQKIVNDTDEKIVNAVKDTSLLNIVEPKFHEGDWVVTSYGRVNQVIAVDEDGDGFTLDDGTYFSGSWKDGYHLWTISDAKEGDVLVFDDIIMIFKNIKTVCTANTYILYCNGIVVDDWCDFGDNAHPATKSQRDTLFAKMKEAGFEWDSEKKELKKIEQKPILDFKASNWCVSKVDGKIHDMTYNPTDKIEPKFKVGDFIVNDYCVGRVVEITNDAYLLDTGQGIPFSCEHNVHLWTINDAKDGDVLVENKGDIILMFRRIGNTEWNDVIDYHCYYDCYRKDFIVQKDCQHWGDTNNNQLKPATKEQSDLLFAMMKEAGYKWDAEKKELKKIEQKPAWSEEDKEMFKLCVDAVEYYYTTEEENRIYKWLKSLKYRVQPKQEWSDEDERERKRIIGLLEGWLSTFKETCYAEDCKCGIDWLKSLKDRATWKPNEEQMQVFEAVYEWYSNNFAPSETLTSLYNDLKKFEYNKK